METFQLGRYELKFQHREVDGDFGPALHLFGPKAGQTEEILRFDCFVNEPHYHVGFSYRDAPFIRIESEMPLNWAIQKLSSDIQSLLVDADAERMTSDEVSELVTALSQLRVN